MTPDRIRAALHSAAVAPPDRTAILARIERGQAALDRPRATRAGRRRSAVRAVGMAATVAVALGFSVAATWAAVGTNVLHGTPHDPIVAPASVTLGPRLEPKPVTTSPASSPARASSRTPSRTPSLESSPAPTPVGAGTGQPGFLHASGAIDSRSIDNWSQSDVTLVTGGTITTLEVTVRIAGTPYLSSTGAWSTIPAANLATTVEQQRGGLVYRFTLKPGVSLGAGSYAFGVQYNHAVGGRDPSRDTYQAVATAGGRRVEVDGGF